MVDFLLQRKSVRNFKRDVPDRDLIEKVVKAGRQAPFASQLYSIILSQEGKFPFGAPLLFTFCVDVHKLKLIMKKRDWEVASSDLALLLFGTQDATLAAGQMITAAEILGLGTCLLGSAPYRAEKIIEEYELPQGVFPLVQMVMGYPAEDPPPRPRYPLNFVLFENEYPKFTGEEIEKAMQEMDEGYLNQDYYRKLGGMIPLERGREETFSYDDYSWTEHISRKWGQWLKSTEDILEKFKACGLDITGKEKEN